MVTFNAHFDGKVIVPDEPLALKPHQRLRISVEPIDVQTDSPKGKRTFVTEPGVFVYVAPDFDEHLGDDFWGIGDEK